MTTLEYIVEQITEELKESYEFITWEEVQDLYDTITEDYDFELDELPVELDEDTLDRIVKEVNEDISYRWGDYNTEISKEYERSCWVWAA